MNHDGSLDKALELVDVAASAGADAVKFQSFRAGKLASAAAPKAEYQKRETGSGSQFEMLKALELSEEMHHAILKRCALRDIEFMSTPFDVDSARFLASLGVKRLKLPSGEITNKPYVEGCADLGLPLIVSTGMADMDEVREALAWIDARAGSADVTVLHCTSNYPADAQDANLAAMRTIARETGRPVGYSDHTMGIAVPTAAVAMGAVIIEKHFTLDPNAPGPDHKASLTPEELVAMVSAIRTIESAIGDGIKAPKPSEIPVRDVARRSLILARAVPAGRALSPDDIAILRPGTGIAPKHLAEVAGRRLKHDAAPGTVLTWEDLA